LTQKALLVLASLIPGRGIKLIREPAAGGEKVADPVSKVALWCVGVVGRYILSPLSVYGCLEGMRPPGQRGEWQ